VLFATSDSVFISPPDPQCAQVPPEFDVTRIQLHCLAKLRSARLLSPFA